MNFVAARVLIKDSTSVYRAKKWMLVFDVISIAFAFSVYLLLSEEIVVEIYRTVTEFTSVEKVKLGISAAISLLLYMQMARKSNKLVVTPSHYALLLHPITLSDYFFAKTLHNAFMTLRYLMYALPITFALTAISGNTFSAILAFAILCLSVLYLATLENIAKIVNARVIGVILLVMSIFDLTSGKVTASLPVYLAVDAFTRCYTDINVFPFLLAFALSQISLYVAAGRYDPEISLIKLDAHLKGKSERVSGALGKVMVEAKRLKLPHMVAAAPLTYAAGKFLPLPNIFQYGHAFLIIFVIVVEYAVLEEASTLWMYRLCNAVRDFVKSMYLKSFAYSAVVMIHLTAFALAKTDVYTFVLKIVSAVLIIIPFYSILAIYLTSKTRFRLWFKVENEVEFGHVSSVPFVAVMMMAPIAISIADVDWKVSLVFSLVVLAVSFRLVEAYAGRVEIK